MSAGAGQYTEALEAAARHARRWLASLPDRHVGPGVTAHDLVDVFAGPLPQRGMPAADVVDFLALKAEPGLMAMPSGRFFGWVIGGTLPAALAADWLVSAWDQNSGLRYATPAIANATAITDVATISSTTAIANTAAIPNAATIANTTTVRAAEIAALPANVSLRASLPVS